MAIWTSRKEEEESTKIIVTQFGHREEGEVSKTLQ